MVTDLTESEFETLVMYITQMMLSLNFSYSCNCKQEYEIRLRRFLQWETVFLTEHSVKVLINEWNETTMNRNLSKCKICFVNITKLNIQLKALVGHKHEIKR
jgi:hypothetical protein